MHPRIKRAAAVFDHSIRALAKILVGAVVMGTGKFYFGVVLVPLGVIATILGALQFTGIWPRLPHNS